MVVAVYDYDAQQEGDLSFRKDDRIELVQRTADTNDWWTGRLNGRQGIFPGKKEGWGGSNGLVGKRRVCNGEEILSHGLLNFCCGGGCLGNYVQEL